MGYHWGQRSGWAQDTGEGRAGHRLVAVRGGWQWGRGGPQAAPFPGSLLENPWLQQGPARLDTWRATPLQVL